MRSCRFGAGINGWGSAEGGAGREVWERGEEVQGREEWAAPLILLTKHGLLEGKNDYLTRYTTENKYYCTNM